MAHFTTLDESNIVTKVEVINNDVILDGDGVEQEQLGIDFLTSLYGAGNYVQTSYNGNFRKQFAGKGFTYDVAKDKFISIQPYPSWALDNSSISHVISTGIGDTFQIVSQYSLIDLSEEKYPDLAVLRRAILFHVFLSFQAWL